MKRNTSLLTALLLTIFLLLSGSTLADTVKQKTVKLDDKAQKQVFQAMQSSYEAEIALQTSTALLADQSPCNRQVLQTLKMFAEGRAALLANLLLNLKIELGVEKTWVFNQETMSFEPPKEVQK